MQRSLCAVVITFLVCMSLPVPTQTALAQADNQPPAPTTLLIINQIGNDPTDPAKLASIELFDGGTGALDLTGLVVALLNRDDQAVAAYDLAGFATNADGYFVLGNGNLSPPPDLAFPSDVFLSDVASAAIFAADGSDFTLGAPITVTNVIDTLAFSASAADDTDIQMAPTAYPAPQAAESTLVSASTAVTETANLARGDTGVCGGPASLIHEVQGAGAASPMVGATVLVEGVVTGDFQDTRRGLRGFFLQDEENDFDSDPATSQGIFVFESNFDVRAGDLVRVKGNVHEFNQLTELKSLSGIQICSRDNAMAPIPITLPEATDGDLERYEGMLVRIDSPMAVAQTYFLGRYGQLTLSAGDRLWQPTHLFPPGSPEAVNLAAENARRLLFLDDGQDIRALGDNPNPVPYIGAPPPAVIRAGDTVTNLIGVLDFGRINSAPQAVVGLDYRLHPTAAPVFNPANMRSAAAPDVGGALKLAGFNVLNYFNGDGNGGGFPTTRGAATPSEFERQRAKIIAALRALDADIVGLMELENDSYDANSAIQDLVNGLNESVPASQTYAFIDPGVEKLGGDEIKVGILYKPARVTPLGAAATLDTGAFDQNLPDGGRSRQPLAQTFADTGGEHFTIVVNHFKSKNPSGNATAGNADTDAGVGAWNQRRTEAAQAIIAWLATDPTGSGDPDFLIVGDLNAYAKETPITTIEAAGYINLLERFGGSTAYSYVFDGQSGYLDHALASASLAAQTTGAADWHINADEPLVIGYEERFNPPGYYEASPYRASDHDPVLVGFNLATITTTEPITITPVITEPVIVTPTEPITVTPVITEPVTITPTEPFTITPVITEPVTITPTEPITTTPLITEPVAITTTEPITTTPLITEPVTTAPSGGFEYIVVRGDSLTLLAQRFGVTVRELAQENGLRVFSYLYVGQRLRIPAGGTPVICTDNYIVQRGDTLSAIGRRYGIGYGRLAAVNNIANPNLIRVGQRLCIPGAP